MSNDLATLFSGSVMAPVEGLDDDTLATQVSAPDRVVVPYRLGYTIAGDHICYGVFFCTVWSELRIFQDFGYSLPELSDLSDF